jgi:uncharacterized membrane protein
MSTPPQPGSNPYDAPLAPVSDAVARDGGYVERARALPASRGFAWYGEAWRLFTVSPGAWIAIWLIFFLCLAVVSLLPLLGMFGNALLSPIFLGGAMLAARSADRSGFVPIGHVFAAFGSHAGPLALVGLLQLVAMLVIFVLGGMIGGALMFSMIGVAGVTPGSSPADMLSRTWLPFVGMGVVFGIIYLPIAYAVWLASALITLNDLPALDALRMGFVATFRNLLPLIVFALALMVLAVLATLPVLLGWLVLGPVVLCAIYVQYREMFVVAR